MKDDVMRQCEQLNLKSITAALDATIHTAETKNWSLLQSLNHLLNLEIERRNQNRMNLRYKQSKLNAIVTIDQFDFHHHVSRKNQKNTILNLMTAAFIKQKKDVILIGHPGTGKTFIAKCAGYQATQLGFKVLFTSTMDMINHLIAAEADHSLIKKLNHYQAPDLLICDEIGYLPLGGQGSNLFFQVISGRHQQKSTMITTNLPFADWGKLFENTTVATAIADRLVDHSEILILEGSSYRKKEK